MDDLAFLHARIPTYADYADSDARRLADEQIRAYVGEALARVLERLQPSGDAGDTLAHCLFVCQFADQRLAHDFDARDVSESEVSATAAADRELVTLADRADAMDVAGLPVFIAHIEAAFGRRWQRARRNASATPIPPAL